MKRYESVHVMHEIIWNKRRHGTHLQIPTLLLWLVCPILALIVRKLANAARIVRTDCGVGVQRKCKKSENATLIGRTAAAMRNQRIEIEQISALEKLLAQVACEDSCVIT